MMRYLKEYNSQNDDKSAEIVEFCKMNLSYLVDEGLRVFVDNDEACYTVVLSLRSVDNNTWIAIKDWVIPFLIRLNTTYQLDHLGSNNLPDGYNIEFNVVAPGKSGGFYWDQFKIEQIIKDQVKLRIQANDKGTYKIKTIMFYIKK